MSDSSKERYEICQGNFIRDPAFTSIPVRRSIVDDEFKDNAMNKLRKGIKSIDQPNKWHRRFLELSKHIAQWSKDRSTKCGSVIVDEKQRIVSLGYNGFSRGVHDTDERLNNRELKYELIIHAELNALLFANKPVDGCTLYVVPLFPCSRCASMIIQAGISMVVAPKLPIELKDRWGESIQLSKQIFIEAQVKFIEL